MKRKELCLYPLVLTFLVLFAGEGLAQYVLSGRVLLADKTPATGAFVQAYQGNKTLALTATDAAGHWQIALTDTTGVRIKIRYLGYKDSIVVPAAVYRQEALIVLRSDAYQLEQIQVKARKPMILRRGDTAIYDMKWYTNRTDQNLASVINKMPGLEVSNKQIKYLGKKVDKLLLEGKDLLRDQHQLLLDNYLPEDISQMEIYENYKPFMQRGSGQITDKTALNIVLTEEARNKVKWQARASCGWLGFYRAKANLFAISGQRGRTAYLIGNNTGESTLTPEEYFGYRFDDLESRMAFGSVNLIKELNTGIFLPGPVYRNRDFLAAYIDEKTTDERTTTKIDVLASSFFRQSQFTSFKSYWNGNPSVIGAGNRFDEKKYLNLRFARQGFAGDHGRYKWHLPLTIDDSPASSRLEEAIDSSRRNLRYNHPGTTLSMAPALYYNHDFANKYTFSTAARLLLQSREYANEWREYPALNAPYFINRIEEFADAQLALNLRVRHTERWSSFVYSRLFHTRQKDQKLQDVAAPDILQQNTRYTKLESYQSYQLRYRKRRWLAFAKLSLLETKMNTPLIDTLLLLPSLQLYAKYRFSLLRFLVVSLQQKSSVADISYFSGQHHQQDYNTIVRYNLQKVIPADHLSLNIIYSKYNMQNHSSNMYRGIFIKSKNAVVFIDTFVNRVYFRRPVISGPSTEGNASIKLAQSFSDNQSIIRFDGSIRDHRYHLNEGKEIRVRSGGLSLGYQSNFDAAVNAGVNVRADYQARFVEQIRTDFLKYGVGLTIRYQSKDRLKGSVEARLLNIRSGKLSDRQFLVNSSMEYRLSKHWGITFTGLDMFHLRPRRTYSFSANENFVEFRSYRTFTGRLLLGVRWRF